MHKPNLFCAALTSIVTHDLSALQAARNSVNRTLEHDPIQPAAIVAFTLLELFDGQADKANKLVAPLVKNFPRNPFYQMAATEIVFHKQNLPNNVAIDMLRKVEGLVTGWDELTVLLQLACIATLRGLWSYGIPLFVRALRAREQANGANEEDLIILWKRNEASLSKLFDNLPSMDREGAQLYNFDSVPIDTLARTFCILFTADFAGVREAWPPCLLLASYHQELNRAWTSQKIPDFLIQHCSDWMMYEASGSSVRTTPFDRN
jgi:hypothetical protein